VETNGITIEMAGGTIHAPDWAAVASLNKKMATAMGKVGSVGKLGFNQQDKYKFVEHADVAAAVQCALSDAGIAHYFQVVSVEQSEPEWSRGFKSVVTVESVFGDSDTGAVWVTQWTAEAMDYGMKDKGINKATTAAQKYQLMRTFIIPTKDDDADAGETGQKQDEQKQDDQQSEPKQNNADKHWASTEGWKFYEAAGQNLGLDKDATKRAFGVESMTDYPGSTSDAKKALAVLKCGLVDNALGLDQVLTALSTRQGMKQWKGTLADAKELYAAYVEHAARAPATEAMEI